MVSQDTMILGKTSSSSSSSQSIEYSSSSSTSAKPTITQTKSNKRKSMLTFNGCHFPLKNFNRKKTIKFWCCVNKNCGVLLHTNLNDQFVRFCGKTTDHSHLPNPAELGIRNLREAMPQRAENELLSLQEIAVQRIKELYDRFNNNQITAQDLLRGLSFFCSK
jgi:hypothetical protein